MTDAPAGFYRALLLLLVLACGGCASLSTGTRDRAQGVAFAARSRALTCGQSDACAIPSPLRALGDAALAASTPDAPRHSVVIVDRGPDALLARVNLIRSARHSIALQTYIFDEDDAGHLILEELIAAARRGVRVRLIVDAFRSAESWST